MRSDDLAPLLGPGPGDPTAIRGGQGVVVEWDSLTAENVIRFRGTDLVNLPILASSTEVLLIQPGDSVFLHIVGSGAAATIYVVGRITQPGTAQAASFMELFGAEAATRGGAVAQGHTYPTYATAPDGLGPSVTVQISNTRRALVTIGAFIQYHFGTGTPGSYRAGRIGYRIISVATGTETSGAQEARSLIIDTEGNEASLASASHVALVSGSLAFPNPGLYTFEAMYATFASDAGGQMFYGHRTIAVLPL